MYDNMSQVTIPARFLLYAMLYIAIQLHCSSAVILVLSSVTRVNLVQKLKSFTEITEKVGGWGKINDFTIRVYCCNMYM
jgi:hypothetical protein